MYSCIPLIVKMCSWLPVVWLHVNCVVGGALLKSLRLSPALHIFLIYWYLVTYNYIINYLIMIIVTKMCNLHFLFFLLALPVAFHVWSLSFAFFFSCLVESLFLAFSFLSPQPFVLVFLFGHTPLLVSPKI